MMNIKPYQSITSVTGTGTINPTNLRVPEGKIWKLKAFNADVTSGTFTISVLSAYILGIQIALIVDTGETGLHINTACNDIILRYGDYLSVVCDTHAVAGNLQSTILVEEYDAQ